MVRARHEVQLPTGLSPRLLTTEEAARYCGVSGGTFVELVRAAALPQPVRFMLGNRRLRRNLWDRQEIDRVLDQQNAGRSGDDREARKRAWHVAQGLRPRDR